MRQNHVQGYKDYYWDPLTLMNSPYSLYLTIEINDCIMLRNEKEFDLKDAVHEVKEALFSGKMNRILNAQVRFVVTNVRSHSALLIQKKLKFSNDTHLVVQ